MKKTLENRISEIAESIATSRMTKSQVECLMYHLLADVVKKYGILPLVRLMLPDNDEEISERATDLYNATEPDADTIEDAYKNGLWTGLNDTKESLEGN